MSNRDDFTSAVKRAVAARAGWRCSFPGCNKLTIGPSEESSEAVTNIGVAAHITAAAPGGPRYDPSLGAKERAGVGNAMWLCANHAAFIDRDVLTYSAERLRAMKREHEAVCARALLSGSSADLATGALAIGPDIVCTGDIKHLAAGNWTLHLKHFVLGDVQTLASFIGDFAKAAPESRYVLSDTLGDGRELDQAPSLITHTDGYSLLSF